MFSFESTDDVADDPRFVSLVARIVAGTVITHKPKEVHIFKIDHWFDHKWLMFSGKFLGAVGSWRKRLTVPPFVANRIIDEWHYSRGDADGAYQLKATHANIHHRGRAEDNLRRFISQVAPAAALFWYSGDSNDTGRGSLMGYIPTDDDHWPWFLAFVRNAEWRVARRKNIHEYEVRMFRQAGEQLHSASLCK